MDTYSSIYVLCTIGADLHAQSVLINKISATELSRKFIKRALLVGWTIKLRTTVRFPSFSLVLLPCIPAAPLRPGRRRSLRWVPPAPPLRRRTAWAWPAGRRRAPTTPARGTPAARGPPRGANEPQAAATALGWRWRRGERSRGGGGEKSWFSAVELLCMPNQQGRDAKWKLSRNIHFVHVRHWIVCLIGTYWQNLA